MSGTYQEPVSTSVSTGDPMSDQVDAPAPRTPVSKVMPHMTNAAYIIGTFIFVVAVWQAAVTLFDVSKIIVPSPLNVLNAISTSRDFLFGELGYTLQSTLLGFGVAAVSALVCALLVTEIPLLRKTLYPLIVSFQAMPHIGLAPLMIIWFGFGSASHVALSSTVAFFPIFANMAHGLDIVKGERIMLFRSYGATRLATIWKLKLPMSLPFFFAGANVGVIFAMLAVIVAEFLGSNRGMGFLLVEQLNQLNTPAVFAVLVILGAVGLLLHGIVNLLRRVFLRWV